jgi:hypothetical protein
MPGNQENSLQSPVNTWSVAGYKPSSWIAPKTPIGIPEKLELSIQSPVSLKNRAA